MRKLICVMLSLCAISAQAQTFVDLGAIYPINADGDKYSINGFVAFDGESDEDIYAKALIWAIENISPKQHEGISPINHSSKDFKCQLLLSSKVGSGLSNIYHCNATFRVASGKLLYYFTDIMVESSNPLFKRITPFESLSPQKNQRHKQTIDDYVDVSSLVLNKLFDHIVEYELESITHWDNVKNKYLVEGMNRDECRLAVGKPQSITESAGEEQWMYSSSFYIFFKNGVVVTIIK